MKTNIEIPVADLSDEMREVLALAETTRVESNGAFNIRRPSGFIDPSGIVKGWAILNAADRVRAAGIKNFYVDAGGDIQTGGVNGFVQNPPRHASHLPHSASPVHAGPCPPSAVPAGG